MANSRCPIVHALCHLLTLSIHHQVTTRLVCSSCPVAYWFAAHLLTSEPTDTKAGSRSPSSPQQPSTRPESAHNMEKMFTVELLSSLPSSFWGQVVISYFMLYYLLGTILFSNFLPWTWDSKSIYCNIPIVLSYDWFICPFF